MKRPPRPPLEIAQQLGPRNPADPFGLTELQRGLSNAMNRAEAWDRWQHSDVPVTPESHAEHTEWILESKPLLRMDDYDEIA